MSKQRYAFVIYEEGMCACEYIYRCGEDISVGNIVVAPIQRGKYYSLALVTRVEYLSDVELPYEKSRILYLDKPLCLRDEAFVFDNIAFLRACVEKYLPSDWKCVRNEENWLAYDSDVIKGCATYEYDDGTVFCDYGDFDDPDSMNEYTITGSDNIKLKLAYIGSLMSLVHDGRITPGQFCILKELINGQKCCRPIPKLKHCEQTPILGLKRGTVKLLPHCSEWADIAADLIRGLRDYFDCFAIDIQHVGSTAINGICAKPIIDIVVGVENINHILHVINGLCNIEAYLRGSDRSGQLLFVTGNIDKDIRTAHIHIVKHGSEDWNNYINFRDYLNAFPDKAREYDALKKRLADMYGDNRAEYTKAKQAFIERILTEARNLRNG